MDIRKKATHIETTTRPLTKQATRQPANRAKVEDTEHLTKVLWFTEKQVMPLLSPFWSYRLLSRP